MYVISKEFHFSASHILYGLSDGHPCGRLHGHNYTIIVTLGSPKLDKTGFVTDYGLLKPIKDFLDNELDHRHLNDVMGQIQPSAENIAKFIFDKFVQEFPTLKSIGVKETEKTIATYSPTYVK